MIKKFDIPCDFGGKKSPVTLYIGDPREENHPLQFQNNWLSSTKGGSVPSDIMDSIGKIRDLALKNNVSFEDLCYFAVKKANGTLEASEENPDFENLLLNAE